MPSTDDENLHPPPASTINTARERQPGTPSTLGDGSFRDSPTRAACAARAAAAAAARLQASALPHDSSSEEEEVEEETVEDIVLEQVGVVPVPVAESTSASAARTTTKRLYDTSVRDQVRTYYDIAPGTGSYQLGATADSARRRNSNGTPSSMSLWQNNISSIHVILFLLMFSLGCQRTHPIVTASTTLKGRKEGRLHQGSKQQEEEEVLHPAVSREASGSLPVPIT